MEQFLSDVMDIKNHYQTSYFMRRDLLTKLSKIDKSNRLNLILAHDDEFNTSIFRQFLICRCTGNDLKDTLNYIHSVLILLDDRDKQSLIDTIKHPECHEIFMTILNSKFLSETERLELANTLCSILKNHLTKNDLYTYFHTKYNGKTYTDYASESGNKSLFDTIYEIAEGKKYVPYSFFIFRYFQPTIQPEQRDFLISKTLRQHTIDENKNAPNNKDSNNLPSSNEIHPNDVSHTANCLATENGLFALEKHLLTPEQAYKYSVNETLEQLLSDSNLTLLKLLKPEELENLKSKHIFNLDGEYAYIALEEKLITYAQLLKITDAESSYLNQLLTYYGIIALREKLITVEEAFLLASKDFCGTRLSDILSLNGITALREKLYTIDELLAVDDPTSFTDMLKLEKIEQRRKTIASQPTA